MRLHIKFDKLSSYSVDLSRYVKRTFDDMTVYEEITHELYTEYIIIKMYNDRILHANVVQRHFPSEKLDDIPFETIESLTFKVGY